MWVCALFVNWNIDFANAGFYYVLISSNGTSCCTKVDYVLKSVILNQGDTACWGSLTSL